MSEDPTQRFTSRVRDYEQHRPAYPDAIINIVREECGLEPSHGVADIGSGTGLLAAVFLRNGNWVYGIEPNDAMRLSGEHFLRDFPNFISVAGRAEATTLPAGSVDFVTAGAAIHWFDPEPTRVEFARILRHGGWLLVVSNRRRTDSEGPGASFQELMNRYGENRKAMRRRHSDETLYAYFGPDGFSVHTCENRQSLDWPGLQGLMQSYSSMPLPGQPGHDDLARDLGSLWTAHAQEGRITLKYDTRICFGKLEKPLARKVSNR